MHMDDRLVHGQVVMTWIPRVQANVVLVANDAVFNDKIRRSTMKLAVPTSTKIGFRKNAPMIRDNLNLTLEDIDSFKRIMAKGIKVGMQPTPTHKFEDLSDTFKSITDKQ